MKIRRIGFSLMEMMVVLLIISIIAAATAPMVSKRMISTAKGDSPWVWSGVHGSIAYNLGSSDTTTATIGDSYDISGIHPRLFIRKKRGIYDDPMTPHIVLGDVGTGNNSNRFLRIRYDGHRRNLIMSTEDSEKDSVNASILDATAFGHGAIASATGSTAIGSRAQAIRSYAVAIGSGSGNVGVTEANAGSSIAIGQHAVVDEGANGGISLGLNSHSREVNGIAIGRQADAASENSIVIGVNSDARKVGAYNAASSVVLGSSASAYYPRTIVIGDHSNTGAQFPIGTNEDSIAIGTDSVAVAQNTISMGRNTASSSPSAIAIGSFVNSSADNAVSVGSSITNSSQNSVVLGANNKNINGESAIVIGSNIDLHDNVYGGNNNFIIAMGEEAEIKTGRNGNGNGSIAIGQQSKVIGASTATAVNSIAIGSGATIRNRRMGSSANDAIAIGTNSFASRDSAIAFGNGARSTQNDSIAIGRGASAKHENSIAIGNNAETIADNIIVLGSKSIGTETEVIQVRNSHRERKKWEWYWPTYGWTWAIPEEWYTVYDEGYHDVTVTHTTEALPNVYIPGNLVVGGKIICIGTVQNENNPLPDDEQPYIINSTPHQKVPNSYWTLNYTGNKRNLSFTDAFWNTYLGPTTSTSYSSDRRLKNVGEAFKGGLEEIKKLEVFNYTFKKDPQKTPRVGVIAQDLMKIFPNAVFKGEDGFYKIRMEDMFYALVNAVKELDSKITALSEQVKENVDVIAQLKQTIDSQQSEIVELKKQNAEFEKRLAKLEKKNKKSEE